MSDQQDLTDSTPPRVISNVDFLYQEAVRALESQKEEFEYIDKKAHWFLAFNSLAFFYVLTSVSVQLELYGNLWLAGITPAILFLFATLWPKWFMEDVDIVSLVQKYGDKSEKEAKICLIEDFCGCWDQNNRVLKKKQSFFQKSLIVMILAGIPLVIAKVIELAG